MANNSLFSVSYLLQLFFSLIVTIGLIYLAARFFLPKLNLARGSEKIKIIARKALEPQVTAYLLGAYESEWLILVSHKNVVKIDKVDSFKEKNPT